MPFPFHNLPLLIQWKILRQYVPTFTKSSVLYNMPEFRNLLEDKESWLHPRIPFVEPGVYFCEHEWWKGFYVVSIGVENISFEYYRSKIFSGGESRGDDVFLTNFRVPLSDVREFFSGFTLMTLWNERNIDYFKESNGDILAVNRMQRKLSCHGSTLHSVRKNGKCYEKVGPNKFREITVKKNGTLETREPRYSLRVHPYADQMQPQTLTRIPLDSFQPLFGRIYDFKFNFRMRRDLSVSVEFVLDIDKNYPYLFEKNPGSFYFYRIPTFHEAINTMRKNAMEACERIEADRWEAENGFAEENELYEEKESEEEEEESEEEGEVSEEKDVFKKYGIRLHYVDIEINKKYQSLF